MTAQRLLQARHSRKRKTSMVNSYLLEIVFTDRLKWSKSVTEIETVRMLYAEDPMTELVVVTCHDYELTALVLKLNPKLYGNIKDKQTVNARFREHFKDRIYSERGEAMIVNMWSSDPIRKILNAGY